MSVEHTRTTTCALTGLFLKSRTTTVLTLEHELLHLNLVELVGTNDDAVAGQVDAAAGLQRFDFLRCETFDVFITNLLSGLSVGKACILYLNARNVSTTSCFPRCHGNDATVPNVNLNVVKQQEFESTANCCCCVNDW